MTCLRALRFWPLFTLLASALLTMAEEPMPGETAQGRNRLAGSTSPYLLQHKDNPVHWYPWGAEALEAARRQQKPIFLSIGYSACHWCHVMEEESFEDPETAALMNDDYISIKVDREERPDLDDIYMTAVQLLTGRGGWPMSVWLTPDLKPFYGGTYFPAEPRHGMPSFRQVLTALGEAWRRDRPKVEEQAERIHQAVIEHMSGDRLPQADAPLTSELLADAVADLTSRYDAVHGGFGPAPKFPPHRGLALLLIEYERTRDENLLRMATKTLDAMARGGIYDQIGGGFHRYSTDARWLVPHFEKMLYDNALLADVYTDAWLATHDEEYRRITLEIFDWLAREMTGPEGPFYSTLDADSEGQEGKYYVWRPSEIDAILEGEEAELFRTFYGITEAGNFEGGTSIPHIVEPAESFAESRGLQVAELRRRLDAARKKLLAARAKRVRPHLDDKFLAAWNGLMIAALAKAARVYDEPRLIEPAKRAAVFILARMRAPDGLLRVSYREGLLNSESFLDDQAFFLEGLIALYEATSEDRWLDEARALVKATDTAFWDPVHHGFFFTLPDRKDLLVRPKNPIEGALPSGNSVMAGVLIEMHHLTGEEAYLRRARDLLTAFAGAMSSLPGAFHNMLISLDRFLSTAAAGTGQPIVAVTAIPDRQELRRGGTGHIDLRLDIRDGWHVNSATPSLDYLIPTAVSLQAGGGVRVESTDYPEAKMLRLGFAGRPIAIYEKGQTIRVTLTASPDVAPGPVKIEGSLTYQACDDRACLRPAEAPIAFTLEIVPGGR